MNNQGVFMVAGQRQSKLEYIQNPSRDMEEGMFNEALQGRGGGIWAGTAFGLAYGTAAGALIGLVPGMLGYAPLSVVAVGGSAALCGALGALSGRVAGGENGSASGAAVGSSRVILTEMRAQMQGIRKELQDIKVSAGMALPGEAVAEPPPGPPAETKVTENVRGAFNWKTFALSFGLGAAVGAVIWAASYMLAGGGGDALSENLIGKNVLTKLGFGGSAGAQALGSALIGGAAAGTFGFNLPRLSSKIYTVARRCISGRVFEKAETTAQSQQMAVAEARQYVQATGLDDHIAAHEARRVCYQEVVAAQREQLAAAQLLGRV